MSHDCRDVKCAHGGAAASRPPTHEDEDEDDMDEQVPWTVGLMTGTLMVAGALLVHLLVRRAAEGRLGRNPWAGIRTAATMAGDEAWRAGHRAGRGATDVAAVGLGLSGVLAVPATSSAPAFVLVVLAGTLWMLGWALVSARRADAAAEAVTAGRGASGPGPTAY